MLINDLVSVIVPIYNVEQYLEECIESIINQTYKNLEILLIDDGSTDKSLNICKDFKDKDARIKVFHNSNYGASYSRNFGIEKSKGKWISFVDSDDILSPIFIQTLLYAAINNNCLISCVPFGVSFKNKKKLNLLTNPNSIIKSNVVCEKECQKQLLYQKLDTGAPWRIYNKSLLKVDDFPIGLYYEDLACIYKIIHRANRICILYTNKLYAYRQRENSLMRQDYSHRKVISSKIICDELYKNITYCYPDLSNACASRCFSLSRLVFSKIGNSYKYSSEANQDRNMLWAIIKKYRVIILFDKNARKRERLAAFFACIGLNVFYLFCKCCKILKIM